jgi:hypothetical protein
LNRGGACFDSAVSAPESAACKGDDRKAVGFGRCARSRATPCQGPRPRARRDGCQRHHPPGAFDDTSLHSPVRPPAMAGAASGATVATPTGRRTATSSVRAPASSAKPD